MQFRTSWTRRPGAHVLRTLSATVAILTFAGVLAATPQAAVASPGSWAPVQSGDFPDPSVLQYGGVSYMFATQSIGWLDRINVQVSTSHDGVHWNPSGVDALPTDHGLGSWAQPGNTWAPSVVFDQTTDTFVMYYSATEASTGDECIGAAVAPVTSPLGPYVDTSSAPVVCQNGIDGAGTVDNGNYGGSIDPDIFHDPASGQSWLIWKSDGNHIGLGRTGIWSVPLTPSLVPAGGATATLLLADDQPWQDGIVEGPDMYFRPALGGGGGGTYYLFYGGGNFQTPDYALGWATCASPSAPCTEGSSSNPVLTSSAGMSGPGGPDIYTLPSGQLVAAFSAWQGSTVGYQSCGVRPVYLADVSFGGGSPAVPSLAPDPAGGSVPAVGPSCPPPPPPPPIGYWQVAADGGVFTFGAATFYGSAGSLKLNQPVVGMAPTPDHRGYWLVARDGGVFAFGDAGFYGSTGGIKLNEPIVGMLSTLDGRGYWLVASDGGVFAFGDATFYGSAVVDDPDSPVTAAAPGSLGGGYLIADAGGQVFTFGDAGFEGDPPVGSVGPGITGLAATHDSKGYWLVSTNGNVTDQGDALPYGSISGIPLNAPMVGMASTPDGAGYWLQGGDGGIFAFGDAPFLGSMGGQQLNAPMVGIAAI